jgi:hypothetical protein
MKQRKQHRSTRDVTKATNPYLPPTYTTGMPGAMGERNRDVAPVKAGPKLPDVTTPTMVSGFSKDISSRESNHNTNRSFELPEKVSARQIQQDSFRYGGGRSAGNRSLAANRKINQP